MFDTYHPKEAQGLAELKYFLKDLGLGSPTYARTSSLCHPASAEPRCYSYKTLVMYESLKVAPTLYYIYSTLHILMLKQKPNTFSTYN